MTTKKGGRIFVDYWVRCGLCGEDTCLAASIKEMARQETVRLGFKHMQGHGLVCKECQDGQAKDDKRYHGLEGKDEGLQ